MEMKKKINVLQLIEGFGWGGAEKKLLELVQRMDREVFSTTVCSLGLYEHIGQQFENIRAKVVRIARKRRVDFSLIPKVAGLIKENRIDVVMTNLFYADMIGAIAGKLANVGAIFFWEASPVPEWLWKRRLWPYMLAVRLCDRVIAVSDSTAQFLREKRGVPADKISVIPYGVDLNRYSLSNNSDVRRKLGIHGSDRVIGVVARLHPGKGHAYLIDAAQRIAKEFAMVKFVLVGEGDARKDLEERVRRKRLENHFLFLGYRDDVPDIIGAFDIFMLPSLHEGFPNVILEAMACGKPVVATAVGGSVEAVVDGVTGYLVPPKDSEAMQNRLLYLLKDRDLAKQMGDAGRARVEEHFSLEKQVDGFEQLFRSYVQSI
ncbi:MAG: glycosyltransferase [bacterium]